MAWTKNLGQKQLPWIFIHTDTVTEFKGRGEVEHKCTVSIINHLTYQNNRVNVFMLNSFGVSWKDTKMKYEDNRALLSSINLSANHPVCYVQPKTWYILPFQLWCQFLTKLKTLCLLL